MIQHLRVRRWSSLVAVVILLAAALFSCQQSTGPHPGAATRTRVGTTASAQQPAASPGAIEAPYAHTGAADVSGVARGAKALVYVPNQSAGTVQVIDPTSFAVVATYPVAASPEHVTPSFDLSTLWVSSDVGNTLTAIDPATGTVRGQVGVDDPYNLYFTPDGATALVLAERLGRIDARDPATMALHHSLTVPCQGINHADFTANQATLVVSCEFSGQLLVLDAAATQIRAVVDLNHLSTPGATDPVRGPMAFGLMRWLRPGASSMPQDVRLAPDGTHVLVADMLRNGVWVLDAATMTVQRFIPTGRGAHGIYPSRDARAVYVSNRDEASVSVIDSASLQVSATWAVPGGGSPDMGGVSADGSQLWLSGRYSTAVYVFDTNTGMLLRSIPVRAGPHGLLVWPQPGRYSLGHTANMR